MMQFNFFLKLLKESFRDLIPIVLVILFFQLAIIQSVPEGWVSTAVGLVIVGVGLAIFLQGLEIGIFPVGEGLARDFSKHSSLTWLLIFGFLIGFGTTIAEPALAVIADKAASISSGRIDSTVLRLVVAASVGFAILLGVFRIIKGHPIHYYIIAGYILVVSVTFFAPQEIIGLAYDLGGVTTSTVTVPLVAALGIGLASSIKGRNPVIDGFGLIAFASLTPMIFVQIYGIAVYNLVDAKDVASLVVNATISAPTDISISSVLIGLTNVIKDVVPILAIIMFFQYGVLKKGISNLRTVFFGFGLVILGLYAFILGLELGLFSLGETMAYQLTKSGSAFVIYAFAFAIGFSTTMAEPALMAIAKKAKEISDGKINDFALRLFVATGVAMGIALGAFRIVDGGHIHYYIIVGYLLVIILTFIAPKYIIPIAYDSGGVTTSTVTVPLVAALGIGLATNIEGRSPLIDGFGLIAFASLFPMITVMLYGILTEKLGVKSDTEIEAANILKDALIDAENMDLATVNIDGSDRRHSLPMDFSAVVILVPKEKKIDAIQAANKAGASGVTVLRADGIGLGKIDNFYRTSFEANDAMLLFLLPQSLVNPVIKSIIHSLHITTTGKGIAFAFPLSHMKGISLSRHDIFVNRKDHTNPDIDTEELMKKEEEKAVEKIKESAVVHDTSINKK
ncbi:MAG: permease [Arcobacter sp.]|nr:MAG: permease [Arcobacter sp.]